MATRIQHAALGRGAAVAAAPALVRPRAAERAEAGLVSPAASRLTLTGIAVCCAFAPLAFGAVETWARAVVLALLLVLALVWAADCLWRGSIRLRPTLLYAPVAGFIAWAGLQLLLGHTASPHATREELAWAAGLALAFGIVLNAINPSELRRLPVMFSVFGFAVAVFAIFQGFSSPHDTIYAVRALPDGPTAFGPFVNQNHYAGYMELLAPLALALALGGGVRREQRGLFLSMGVVMMLSVVLSLSRAGMAVVAAQVLALLAWRRRLAAMVLLPLLVACALWLGGEPLRARLGTLASDEASLTVRVQAARDAMAIFRDHPLWGTGLGTFAAVYPRYKSFDDGLLWEHAHNDVAQLAAEMGLPGVFCVLAFLVGQAFLPAPRELGRSAAGRNACSTAALFGILVGCSGLLLHSLVDFHFRIPATALTFVVLSGVGVALAKDSAAEPVG